MCVFFITVYIDRLLLLLLLFLLLLLLSLSAVVEPGKRAWNKIKKAFGEEVFHESGMCSDVLKKERKEK